MRLLGGKGVLLLALVLGFATSYLSWRYVQEATVASEPVPLVPVLVATQPVAARTIIAPSMVQVKQVPADARPQGAYAEPTEVVGRVSKTQLAPGEHLLPHQFFLQREKSGLAFLVPDSQRAVSIAVSEVIGTGGMIIPGDKVDVFALFDFKEPPQGSALPSTTSSAEVLSASMGQAQRTPEKNTMIALVLQNVEVLAVAQSLEGDDTRDGTERFTERTVEGKPENAVPQSKARTQPGARTVTVAVTPAEAQKLILAEERGKLRLALRPAAEQGQVDLAPLELRQVLQAPTK